MFKNLNFFKISKSRIYLIFYQIIFIGQNFKYAMRKFLEPINNRNAEGNPENGTTRIQKSTDSSLHLQIFYNGSWRHDKNCKLKTNKECSING